MMSVSSFSKSIPLNLISFPVLTFMSALIRLTSPLPSIISLTILPS